MQGPTVIEKQVLNLKKLPSYTKTLLTHGTITPPYLFENVEVGLRRSCLKRITYIKGAPFCYFRIPKSANSTVIMTLYHNLLDQRALWPKLPKQNSQLHAGRAKRLLHGIPEASKLPSLYTFTVVRHPASRVLSAYLHKSPSSQMHEAFPYLSRSPGTREGFRYFLEALTDGALFDDIHWAPQTRILPWDYNRYSFIGHAERLSTELKLCMAEIFDKEDTEVEIVTADRHRTNAQDMISEFVGASEQNLIEKLYERDYEAFYPNG
jgi:dermatan 4-sulfotransferase 1